jgi:hypothetical protein
MTITTSRTARFSPNVSTSTSRGGETDSVYVNTGSFAVATGTVSPEGSSGVTAQAGGQAVAAGTDTLATGSVAVSVDSEGSVSSGSASVHLTAEAASGPGEPSAFATADANVSLYGIGGIGFSLSSDISSFSQDAGGSTWSATAVEAERRIDTGGGLTAPAASDEPTEPNGSTAAELPYGETAPPPADCGCDATEHGWMPDGNYVLYDVDVAAFGIDTYVDVSLSALTIENSLSLFDFSAWAIAV